MPRAAAERLEDQGVEGPLKEWQGLLGHVVGVASLFTVDIQSIVQLCLDRQGELRRPGERQRHQARRTRTRSSQRAWKAAPTAASTTSSSRRTLPPTRRWTLSRISPAPAIAEKRMRARSNSASARKAATTPDSSRTSCSVGRSGGSCQPRRLATRYAPTKKPASA